MVDVLGHVAMGLLWAAPVWFRWDGRVGVAFVGLVLLTVMVPDVDLYLPGVVHHGATHTVLFVATVALVGAAVLTPAVTQMLRDRWRDDERGPTARPSVYRFVAVALLAGGLSHLFIDMLSAGTGGNPPLEPFWPFFRSSVSIDFIYYSSFAWNGGLLVLALLLHLLLFTLDVTPLDRPRLDSESR